jgi:hypothetical protein
MICPPHFLEYWRLFLEYCLILLVHGGCRLFRMAVETARIRHSFSSTCCLYVDFPGVVGGSIEVIIARRKLEEFTHHLTD